MLVSTMNMEINILRMHKFCHFDWLVHRRPRRPGTPNIYIRCSAPTPTTCRPSIGGARSPSQPPGPTSLATKKRAPNQSRETESQRPKHRDSAFGGAAKSREKGLRGIPFSNLSLFFFLLIRFFLIFFPLFWFILSMIWNDPIVPLFSWFFSTSISCLIRSI